MRKRHCLRDQYDYNKNRVLSGKDALPIADVRWNPNAYDDATNEALAQWYRQRASTPTAADRNNFLRQYKEEKATQNSLRSAPAYQPTAIPGGLSRLGDGGTGNAATIPGGLSLLGGNADDNQPVTGSPYRVPAVGHNQPQIPDSDDAFGRKAYINHVYSGLIEGLQTLAVHPIAALRRCSLPTVTTGNAQAALPARSV